MNNFKFFINIIFINILSLITSAKTSQKIPIPNKLRVQACMVLQEKKYGENDNILNKFLESKSYVYPENPNKIILLAMAYCYDRMSNELATRIINTNIKKIKINNPEISELYNFEKYNYNDTQRNEKIYNQFIPVFNVVYKEITNRESYEDFWKNYKFYFVHTPLFKFFEVYLIINTIIVFYLRIKNRAKYIDESQNEEESDDTDEENKDIKDDSNKDKSNSNNNNYRKLKKRKGLSKYKKD